MGLDPKHLERILAPFLASFLGLFSGLASAYNPDAVLCPLSEYIDDEGESVKEFYECPGPENPPEYTVCCEEGKCCQMTHVDSILGVDLKIAMIISLCVIVLCVISGLVIIICCFAHPCPFYDTCSGSWDKGIVIEIFLRPFQNPNCSFLGFDTTKTFKEGL